MYSTFWGRYSTFSDLNKKKRLTGMAYWKPNKHHFYIYLMYHTETGLYYIGKRSSYVPPHKDHYFGSGKLLWEVYRMCGYYSLDQGKPPGWEKYVIVNYNNKADMDRTETEVIRQERPNELCLNCNSRSKLKRR
jgi:hypothetical protein